jgi:hypothetical protein
LGRENYPQIQRRDYSRGRQSAAVENLIKLYSVYAHPFRPCDLSASGVDFAPQEDDDVVKFEYLHAVPLVFAPTSGSR